MIQVRVCQQADAVTAKMNGLLAELPLAELIRGIAAAGLSGTLRLQNKRIKIALYFDTGALQYASSNLRAHRLIETLKRLSNLPEAQLAGLAAITSDNDLIELSKRGVISSAILNRARTAQVSDVMRKALTWEDGEWEFDVRARLADAVAVEIDLNQLLVECARHHADEHIKSRLGRIDGAFSSPATGVYDVQLLPVEAFVLSRVQGETSLSELTALSGVPEADAYRAIYALTLGGVLRCVGWPAPLSLPAVTVTTKKPKASPKEPAKVTRPPSRVAVEQEDDDPQELFSRLDRARDHYDVLDVGRGAGNSELKEAYHSLARRYHPDRFHRGDNALRARVDSAFARIAQAYEILSNLSSRAAYDARLGVKTTANKKADIPAKPEAANEPAALTAAERAELAFNKGMVALQQQKKQDAVTCLAEAAHLAPREARYRAHYGQALGAERQTRRIAEAEFQAAIALAPDNAAYRVMLAQLYQELGLRRRAQGELERALIAEPKNKEARALLASLQSAR